MKLLELPKVKQQSKPPETDKENKKSKKNKKSKSDAVHGMMERKLMKEPGKLKLANREKGQPPKRNKVLTDFGSLVHWKIPSQSPPSKLQLHHFLLVPRRIKVILL